MNDLLEKAKQMYPIGTKFKDVFDGKDHICDGDYVIFKEDIYVETDCSAIYRCLYHADKNKWAEIVEEEPKCTGDCGANYCDENGCTERKRILVEPSDIILPTKYNIQDWKDRCIRECLDSNKEATIKELSLLLNISVRHLYRELKRLNLRQNGE